MQEVLVDALESKSLVFTRRSPLLPDAFASWPGPRCKMPGMDRNSPCSCISHDL